MAKKAKLGRLSKQTVTLVRSRPAAVQANDTSRQAVLGAELAKGGSATLYAFEPPLGQPAVAKIYSEQFRADPSVDAFTKLVALVARFDEFTARLPFVMWPDELIFDRSITSEADARAALLGFTMTPLPDGTISLFTFLKQEKYRNKFPIDAHVRLAARLAEQLAKLHAAGLVFCDLNPKNIHVSRDLRRSYFLDADGYQATIKGNSVPSRGIAEGYASPAAITNHISNPTALRTPADDDFVLAVLIFQLLVDRAHPFATGPLYAAHPNASLNEGIEARRFAYADPALYRPVGDTESIYARLATPLKAAFLRSFLTPWPVPAAEWTKLLLQHITAPLAAMATPDPDGALWRTSPRGSSTATGGAATSSRRTPSRRLPPVLPIAQKRTAVIAGVLSIPAAVGAGIFLASPPPKANAAAPISAWTTYVAQAPNTTSQRDVTQILEELPEAMDAVADILEKRNPKAPK